MRHGVGRITLRKRCWNWVSSAWSPNQVALWRCVGCDIVQADHAPEAGVAQGIFHGILVRHHGRIQEEVEEGLEEEVERRVKRTLKNKCACR